MTTGLLGVVTSANLACGFHAGDEATMRAVCTAAARTGVVVGAQVSYDDREHFGRRHLDVAPEVLTGWVDEQVRLLARIAEESGTEVSYLKPHGALYNRVVDDEEQARAVLRGSGRCRCWGCPVRRSSAWPRRPADGRRRRVSPTAATPTTAGWCPVTSPERSSRGPRRSPPTRWRWPPTCSRCASTATRPGPSRPPGAVRAALESAGYDVRPW